MRTIIICLTLLLCQAHGYSQNSIAQAKDSFYVINQRYWIGSNSPLTCINRIDIERVQELEIADATAIYGSRAAKGAVVITLFDERKYKKLLQDSTSRSRRSKR